MWVSLSLEHKALLPPPQKSPCPKVPRFSSGSPSPHTQHPLLCCTSSFFSDEMVCHQSKGRDVKTSLVLAYSSSRSECLCRSHRPSLVERSRSKGSCTHTELQVQVAQSKAHSDPIGSKGSTEPGHPDPTVLSICLVLCLFCLLAHNYVGEWLFELLPHIWGSLQNSWLMHWWLSEKCYFSSETSAGFLSSVL